MKKFVKQTVNEVAVSPKKNNETQSCTSAYYGQEELAACTSTKKLKLNEENGIFFCEDDEENEVEFLRIYLCSTNCI